LRLAEIGFDIGVNGIRGEDCALGVDWLSVAELYTLAFFSILIVTVALMFGASLLFWARYPDDLHV
jgi:hypothetical protein